MTESPFFAGVAQTEISIRSVSALAPVFYPRVHVMGGVFLADLEAARSLMPTPSHRPLRVLPGRAAVGIHCLEYAESGIGPYNEVALSVAVQRHGGPKIPGPLAALSALMRDEYHVFITSLPVTTEVALWGGLDFFGFPKFLADISFRETETHRVCTVSERDGGRLILTATAVKLPSRPVVRPRVLTLHSYPVHEGRLLHGRMQVNQKTRATRLFRAQLALSLGDSPHAEPFRRLGIGRQLVGLFAPDCEAMLPLPEVAAGP